MFRIVLVHPQIPPNTGNVIRLCANTGFELHLVEPLGFTMEDAQMRRAGLDYHEYAHVAKHASWEAFLDVAHHTGGRRLAMSTRGKNSLAGFAFVPGDWLIFGSETAGLPQSLLDSFAPEHRLRLPMRAGQRSLNLSNAVAVLSYEAWRQHGYAGGA